MNKKTKITIGVSIIAVIGILVWYCSSHAESTYHTCTEYRATNKINIPTSNPSYNLSQDSDRDGLSCEL